MTSVSLADRLTKTRVMRVLVCAGDRDHRVTLGILLRSEGYVVQLAKDGAEALSLATAYGPDVAFLDIEMADGSGFRVAQELRQRYKNDCPFLIALAGHSHSNKQEQAEISGFHHYLAKPYNAQELLEVLASLDR